jgi:acylphosphatase
MEKAFQIIIEGRVTGVGFRYSALDYAEQFSSLKGYIRNAGYGCVEALVQGESEEVEKMVAWLRNGPVYARVDRFKVTPVPLNHSLESFSIR